MSLVFKKGNAVSALIDGEINVLLHVCNNKCSMASGIALEIRNRNPDAWTAYQNCTQELGWCSFGWNYENRTAKGMVVNMIVQDGYGRGVRRLNYGALAECLMKVSKLSETLRIGIPYKMGADRAGGDWEIVLELVQYILKDFNVTVYELEGG